MTAKPPFKQQFHDSDSKGPSDPKHWMHRTYASNRAIALLTVYGLAMLGAMVWVILDAFPDILVTQGGTANDGQQTATGQEQVPTARTLWEVALLKLVLSFGAVGGLLHLLTSLGRFVGGRRLERSWALFYLLRPPVGAALGLLVYLILRMSALGQGTTIGIPAVNVYGVLAFSGLAGMFSRQAVEKLAEAFDVIFQKTKQEIEDRPLSDLAAAEVREGGAGKADADTTGKPVQKPETVDKENKTQSAEDQRPATESGEGATEDGRHGRAPDGGAQGKADESGRFGRLS